MERRRATSVKYDAREPPTPSSVVVDVKSVWIDMENMPHPERYYTGLATVMPTRVRPEILDCSF